MIKMMAVPKARESRSPYLVTAAPQHRRHPLPAPTPMPAAMHEHERLSGTALVACHEPPMNVMPPEVSESET
jgi:hypothetical protein